MGKSEKERSYRKSLSILRENNFPETKKLKKATLQTDSNYLIEI